MTEEQKRLVQASFQQLAPVLDVLAELFYGRLFDLDPDLRQLFTGNIRVQGRKLMEMLAVLVSGLDHPDAVQPQLEALGARHRQYGVTRSGYLTAASALMWTLEVSLGTAFTPQLRQAWAAAYTLLVESMQTPAQAR
ncbi:MAG: hemin receptor [Chloroflexi bacterium]|nr:hemin receptor [Chloroflexota bacterium]